MEIVIFKSDYLPDMAAIFVADFRALRATVPALPDTFEEPAQVVGKLDWLFTHCSGVVALDGDQLVGYLGWIEADDFRGAGRKGAYIPEWAHSAQGNKQAVYRALLASAAPQWAAAGCGVYAISLLAHDRPLQDFWFWNGFGLIVVDAIRPIDPLDAPPPDGIIIRKATSADVPALAQIELDHAQYYREPPILMAAYDPTSVDEIAEFIGGTDQAYWLALVGDELIGMMRFEPNGDGASSLVNAPDKVHCTGAFVRPTNRSKGVGVALLDAALKDYAARGFARCSVDFESFNPYARAFWLKYFTPVQLSVARIPEREP